MSEAKKAILDMYSKKPEDQIIGIKYIIEKYGSYTMTHFGLILDTWYHLEKNGAFEGLDDFDVFTIRPVSLFDNKKIARQIRMNAIKQLVSEGLITYNKEYQSIRIDYEKLFSVLIGE